VPRPDILCLGLLAAFAACSSTSGTSADTRVVRDAVHASEARPDLRPSDASRPIDTSIPIDAPRPPDRASLPDLAPPPPFRVRVLTYNLQWAGNADYQALSTILLQKAATNQAPDLVLLEECFLDPGVDTNPYLVFHTQLGALYPYQWHGPMLGSKVMPSGVVMLSRLPMLDQQSFAYTSGLLPDSLANKGIAWAKLKTPTGCPPLGALVTHMQAGKLSDFYGLVDPAATRLDQTNELIAQLTLWQGAGLPIVIGGDFNYFVQTTIATDEGLPTGYNGYYTLSHAWGSWLTNTEIYCATHTSSCAAPGLALSSQPYGMLKLFFGETASAGVKPIAVRKYAATDYGALGDHEAFEVDYEVTCH
jgi:endonuclease/exonuclease/phosphatase family metal-dependent hydrolase